MLVSPQLTATASVAWDAARIQGLAFQQGVIDARLAEGVVRVQPLDVGLSEGRLTAAPRIELNATPMALVVDRGPLVRQVRIAPEMCQTWLKYVAPLLADATRAEGRFSVHLDHAKVPLAEPTAADVSGLLNIHSAQVGPGPLGQQLATIANQLKAIIDRRPLAAAGSTSRWIQIPAQDVAFQMVEGRVQHQRFEMIVGDVTVRTSGSVGLDQSIRLTAELPIQDQWVARDRFLAGMKGKTLKIPIRGTLSQPKIDSRVIEDLSKQIIRSSAGSFLEDELNRGLQRLFGPSQ